MRPAAALQLVLLLITAAYALCTSGRAPCRKGQFMKNAASDFTQATLKHRNMDLEQVAPGNGPCHLTGSALTQQRAGSAESMACASGKRL